ncbi:N-acylneuraminate cytidylyltransferase [soil metagenome]
MSVIAIIPARGGSKGVPGKNLRRVGGIPLIVRAVASAKASRLIDQVIVSTDDFAIGAAARTAGATTMVRPAELSGDTASSESALLDVLDRLDEQPDIVVFLQATSPFIDPLDLDAAIERVRDGEIQGGEDVVFSATETFDFLWKPGERGAIGINHKDTVRPRRQEREPQFRETGAFYVMNAAGFRRAAFRFFGTVGIMQVDERTAIEIDTADELELANALAPLIRFEALEQGMDVDAVVTDFDGVHTDDRVSMTADGTEFVSVSRADGLGVRMLRESGIPVLILSTEVNPVVGARAAKLQVEVQQAVDNKAEALAAWAAAKGIPLERIAYVGNDVNDLGALRLVGWPIAVSTAVPEVLAEARVVLDSAGGHGAVRELADTVLHGRDVLSTEHELGERRWLYPSASTI